MPLGYADGYLRSLSNVAVMSLPRKGDGRHTVPVVGRVSMDQVTVDLTDVGEVKVGDEIMVMVTDVSSEGKIRLSRRAVLEGWTLEEAQAADRPSGGRSNRGGNRGGRRPPRRR